MLSRLAFSSQCVMGRDVHFRIIPQHSKMECLAESMSVDPSKHRQELLERLDILRNNDSFCDVTIAVKDKEFKAHRAVLAAASPFFLTLLTSDMKESNEQLIKVELEEATETVMQDALKYLYTGNVTVVEERAHNLIATANFILLPSLKTMVGNVLNVSIENCLFNYYFADEYEVVELKEKCREVINSNFSVVMQTEDFLNLDVKQVMEWVSGDDVIVNAEEDIFQGIVKWVSHDKSEREKHVPGLLHQIRLSSISHDFVLNTLVKEELMTENPTFCLNFVVNAMKSVLSSSDRGASQLPRKCQETHIDGIFICGGKRALCYFPQKDMWYRLADSPFQDYEDHSLVEYKSNIYVADGKTRRLGESHVLEFYSPLKNSWGTVQRNDDITNFTCLTVLKGDMYATCYASISNEGRICRYDSEKNCWQDIDAPPCLRDKACIVADEQFLYIIGGTLDWGESAECTTMRFDPINNKLEELADINQARYNASGAAINGKVFIAGGQSSRKIIKLSTEAFDPSSNEWQCVTDLTLPHFNASMVCFEGMLFVLGGTTYTMSDGITRTLTVEMFDPGINEWKVKSSIPVESLEMSQKKNKYQACFAKFNKKMVEKLQPLSN